MESASLQQLEQIPGVGKNIARDMHNIGINSIDDLKAAQARQLYDKLCQFKASLPRQMYALRISMRNILRLKYRP